MSILTQLHRIFITLRFQPIIYILSTIVLGWCISILFAYVFICSPVWDPIIAHHCVDERMLNLFTSIPWILTDFIILIAPVPMVQSLQLSRIEKVGYVHVL